MNKYDAGEIRALFERGENIIEWVAAREGAVEQFRDCDSLFL